MKTLSRILGLGTALALAVPMGALAQQEPIIAVEITQISVVSGDGSVIAVALTSGGSGYTVPPQVTVTGGDGVGAELVATVANGSVTGLTIVNGGTGYTRLPTISFSPSGNQATASVIPSLPSGQLESANITITNPGGGYTSPPTVTVAGDGTTPATATAVLTNGMVTGITMVNKGAGYSFATITLSPPGNAASAVVTGLGTLFVQPFQNESHGPIGKFFNITAEARGAFPVGGYTYNFFVNGIPLGASVNPQPPGGGPGVISWAPPQPGSYLLTVTASGAGHTATSLAVRYFATGTAMISPVDNTLVPNGSSVVLQATATPAPSGPNAFVQRMDFFVDDTLVGSDTTYPYSYIYTPASSPTTHVVEARGYDNNGNQISPSGTAVRRLNMVSPIGAPPIVRLVNPPDNSSVAAGSTVNMIADAIAPDGFIKNVDFYLNGVLHSSTQRFPFTATWTPQVPGRYQFVAIGFDDKSNAVSSAPISLTVTGAFPTATIIDPVSSGFTIVQGAVLPVTVRAAGPDGGVSSLKSVEFLVNGVVNDSLPKGSTTTTTTPGGTTTTTAPVLTEPFVFNWKSNVAVGTHRLSARVTGINNLSITSPEITVNVVANQPPRIAVTGPTETTTVTMNSPTTLRVNSTDLDGTVESVEFFVDGTRIGAATKAPFEFSWTPTGSGSFQITAKAIDNGGASTLSEAVTVNVDPPATSGSGTSTVAHTVYRGDYGSLTENGRFAFALNRNNRGTLIAYSTVPSGRTYLWTDITVNGDGTFSVRDTSNQVVLSGQTSLTGVSGSFNGKTFIGPVTPSTGAFTPLLVTGSLTGVPNSQVIAIVGGDSSITLHATSGAAREAGSDFLSNTGSYSFATPTGGRLSGTVANTAALVSGAASGGLTGNFLLRQQASRISNISTRSLAGNGDRTMVAGFVISGTGTKPLLVRAVGPTLANFGVTSPLADPSLDILRGSATVASNNDWGNSAPLAALATQLGAFPLSPGSRDAAVLVNATAGMYTAVVGGGGTPLGSALIEIYDGDTSNPVTSRIMNISTRGQVGNGEALIAGFVITGDVRKKLLIRAVGPTLSSFGLTGVLADPKIDVLSGATVISSNNDWTEASAFPQVNSTSPTVGAFPLNPNSRDAAVVLQLIPGAYTVQVSGAGTSSGTVLVEIYDADL